MTLQWRNLEGANMSSVSIPRSACVRRRFSRVCLFETLWTAAPQAPLSLDFSRQEHWSGLPFPSPMHEVEK